MKQLVSLSVLFWVSVTINAATYYVKENGAGDLSGSSWANASDDLQAMINKAQANDVVFVAKGSYYPNKASNHLSGEISPSNRNNAFVLKKDVKIYGSFPADANDNDHKSADSRFSDGWIISTYLLGDITGNKNWDEFAYHIVISAGDVGSALLDGVYIANGNANGGTSETDTIMVNGYQISKAFGGGMYIRSSSPSLYGVFVSSNRGKYAAGMYCYYSSSEISQVQITDNICTNIGGGIYNFYSSPTLSFVSVKGNEASSEGGGINNRNSSPVITNTTFSENKADYGGGMFNGTGSAPICKYVDILNNTAKYGAGIYNYRSGAALFRNMVIYQNSTTAGGGGGASNVECVSDPVYLNVVIAENSAYLGGGGMSNGTASPILVNVTISRNSARNEYTHGGGIKSSRSSRPKVYNSIVWGNIGYPQVQNEENSTIYCYSSLVETVTSTTGSNLDGSINPCFAGALGDDYDYYLLTNSPCIDKGNNTYFTENGGNLETDKDNNGDPRLSGASIDMGAYEFQHASDISAPKFTASIEVIGAEGKIVVKGSQRMSVSISSYEGKLIYNEVIDQKEKEILLSEGIYIVSVNGVAKKVLVK